MDAIEARMIQRKIGTKRLLAQRADLAESILYRLTSRPERTSLSTVHKLCQVLECNPGDILVLK